MIWPHIVGHIITTLHHSTVNSRLVTNNLTKWAKIHQTRNGQFISQVLTIWVNFIITHSRAINFVKILARYRKISHNREIWHKRITILRFKQYLNCILAFMLNWALPTRKLLNKLHNINRHCNALDFKEMKFCIFISHTEYYRIHFQDFTFSHNIIIWSQTHFLIHKYVQKTKCWHGNHIWQLQNKQLPHLSIFHWLWQRLYKASVSIEFMICKAEKLTASNK